METVRGRGGEVREETEWSAVKWWVKK